MRAGKILSKPMQNNETLGRNLSRSQLHRLPFACLRLLATLSLSLVVIALSSGVAYAQDTSVGSQATREALAQRIATDEAEIAAGKVNLARRKVLTAEIAGIRERLENGDFRTGDLVVVYEVVVPKTIAPEAREALAAYARATGEDVSEQHGFFDKIGKIFRGD